MFIQMDFLGGCAEPFGSISLFLYLFSSNQLGWMALVMERIVSHVRLTIIAIKFFGYLFPQRPRGNNAASRPLLYGMF